MWLFTYLLCLRATCAGMDFLNETTFLDFGTHDLREMQALSLPQARLVPASRRRAKLLFELGEDFAYGVWLRSCFQFHPHVVLKNDLTLATNLHRLHDQYRWIMGGGQDEEKGDVEAVAEVQIRPFYIGVHMRHSNEREKYGEAESEMKCLKGLVKGCG